MGTTRSVVLTLIVTLFFLAATGCGGPKVPEHVSYAASELDGGWNDSGPVQVLIFDCAGYTPGLDYISQKAKAALGSSVSSQREMAVNLYASWGNPADKELIQPLLSDESPLVVLLAAKFLASLGEPAALPVLETRIRTQDDVLDPEICGLIAKLGNDACSKQAQIELTSKDEGHRLAAAATLAEIGGEESAQAIRGVLGSLRDEKRVPVITALGQIGNAEKDAKRLSKYLKYRENIMAVVEALGELGGEVSETKLREILSKKDPRASLAAAGALAHMGVIDDGILEALEEGLGAESIALRYEAASYLADAQLTPEVLSLLAKALEDPDAKVNRAALEGLRGHATAVELPALQGAWDRFNELKEGAGYDAALQTVVVVSMIDDPQVDAFLTAAIENKNYGHAMQACLGILQRYGQPLPQKK